jgi:hypothetical protein
MVEQAGLPTWACSFLAALEGGLLFEFVIAANPPAPVSPAKTRLARLSGLATPSER